MAQPPKYPRTPHWPGSPGLTRGERAAPEPGRFLDAELVVSEKLDGSNVLLHQGEVYARSTSAPAQAQPWLAMVRKHHAWKTAGPGMESLLLYGEDVYGVHSLEYSPLPEHRTFYVFAAADADTGQFLSWAKTRAVARELDIPTVPVIASGQVTSRAAAGSLLETLMLQPSLLGGEKEGLVIRLAGEFPAEEFPLSVCKYVRKGHVQPDAEHWSRNWRPCKLLQTENGAGESA